MKHLNSVLLEGFIHHNETRVSEYTSTLVSDDLSIPVVCINRNLFRTLLELTPQHKVRIVGRLVQGPSIRIEHLEVCPVHTVANQDPTPLPR